MGFIPGKIIYLFVVVIWVMLLFWRFMLFENSEDTLRPSYMLHNNATPTRVRNNTEQDVCSMKTRLKKIRQECDKLDIGVDMSLYDVADLIVKKGIDLYVDESHRVMYCPITKSASSSFLNILKDCKGKSSRDREPSMGFRHDFHLPNLIHDYTREEIVDRLKNYLKFTVVRHPFDRLVSAHNYMFQSELKLQFPTVMRTLNELSKVYFDNQTFDATENKLKLEQFLHLVAEEPYEFIKLHWQTFNTFCLPCHVTYDHVIRLETMSSDIGFLLERLSDKGKPCSTMWESHLRTSSDKLQEATELFSDVDPEIIKKLTSRGRYGQDMTVFGYTWSKDGGAGCKTVSTDGKCC